MSATLEPILQSRHFRHGIDKRPVSLPSLVGQHARRTAGWSARRQVMRHVHYTVTEHRAGHQRESRRDGARVPRLVVLRTGRHSRVLLLHRGGRRRRRLLRLLLILGSGGQRQRTDWWTVRRTRWPRGWLKATVENLTRKVWGFCRMYNVASCTRYFTSRSPCLNIILSNDDLSFGEQTLKISRQAVIFYLLPGVLLFVRAILADNAGASRT